VCLKPLTATEPAVTSDPKPICYPGQVTDAMVSAWQSQPDVVCLQETKTVDRDFPKRELAGARYQSISKGGSSWNGVAILARGAEIVPTRRALPGDPSDKQPLYLEAAINGVLIACLYLPNGNPQPGPKVVYKLAWFERLITHASELLKAEAPIVVAGDYNVIPTDFDIYDTRSWKKNALLQPESRECYQRLLDQGWTDALRKLHLKTPMYTFWQYFREAWPRDAGIRLDHFLLNSNAAAKLKSAGVDREVRGATGTVTTRPHGSNSNRTL
jgi:exodeoxyribonuclease III